MSIREKCEGCGKCCHAIYLPMKHSDWKEEDITKMRENRGKEPIKYDTPVLKDMDDRTFVIQNWYPLTREEALERNPHLESWRPAYVEDGIEYDFILEDQFYTCNQLDIETGRCRTHDNLPNVCSGYPWYGRDPSETHQFYAEDCYYKKDLIKETTP